VGICIEVNTGIEKLKFDGIIVLSLLADMFGRTLLVVASLLVTHAAYSTYDPSPHLRALGQLERPVPLNIVYECITALALGIIGASLNTPPLKDITWASEMKRRTIDEVDARPGFANYISRAKSFENKPGIGPQKEK